MIYAASGFFKPSRSLSAFEYAAKNLSVNGSRSSHRLATDAQREIFSTRKIISETFNNGVIERVIFTLNCTEALNFAIFGSKLRYGEIVTTVTEHNAVLRPLYRLRKNGVKVKFAELSDKPFITEDDLLPLVGKKTDLVVINAVSNVTGYRNRFKEIARELKKTNIPIIVDGAQAGGHVAIDMLADGIDCLCLAGHKGLYSTQGVGALIFTENFSPTPTLFGGSGTESFSETPSCYPELLEVGTQNLPAIMSLKEGVFFAREKLGQNSKTLNDLTAYLLNKLRDMPFIKVFSEANPFGIVSFSHESFDSAELSRILDVNFDIAVRGGFHCAPLIHKALSTDIDGLVRVSFSPFNTEREIDALVSALKTIS